MSEVRFIGRIKRIQRKNKIDSDGIGTKVYEMVLEAEQIDRDDLMEIDKIRPEEECRVILVPLQAKFYDQARMPVNDGQTSLADQGAAGEELPEEDQQEEEPLPVADDQADDDFDPWQPDEPYVRTGSEG